MFHNTDYKTVLLRIFPKAQKYRFAFQKLIKFFFYFIRYLPGSSLDFGPPRGVYLDAMSYNKKNKSKIKEQLFDAEMHYRRELPLTNSKLVIEKFEKFLSTKIIEKKAFIIPDARYLPGELGTVITSDDKIFIPTSFLKNEWNPLKHQTLYKFLMPTLVKLDKVILIDTRCADGNYGHWMMDHLPRFYWLKKMEVDLYEYSLVSISKNNSYQSYSYKILQENGFKFKEVIFQPLPYFKCTELIVPPYSTIGLNGDAISYGFELKPFLQSLFLNKGVEKKMELKKKVYLSRRKSLRTWPEEIDLVEKLFKYNIYEIFLEDYTISEQANIFNNADLIVGFHGAGFTNIFFCKKHTKIVEIFGANFIVTNFWGVASQLNLNYIAYCEDSYNSNIENYRLARQAPTNLDIDNFIQFLEPHLKGL